MPQCQVDEAFTIPESEAVLPWDGIQGLVFSPDQDDHNMAKLGWNRIKPSLWWLVERSPAGKRVCKNLTVPYLAPYSLTLPVGT